MDITDKDIGYLTFKPDFKYLKCITIILLTFWYFRFFISKLL